MNIKRNLLTGIITVVPILVTVFVFGFFLDLLSDIGRLLELPWLSSALAIGLTLGMFYLLGWSMTRLLGRQVLLAIEQGLNRIPLVTTVYGATKKLVDAFQADGNRAQKVVLVEFPHARMKAVGLVTRYFVDAETGQQLAAVYVPTAPNPAGGYLEIVPAGELVVLDWTVDQAMAFVLSGGTTAPDRIHFSARSRDTSGATAKPDSSPVQSDSATDERAPQWGAAAAKADVP